MTRFQTAVVNATTAVVSVCVSVEIMLWLASHVRDAFPDPPTITITLLSTDVCFTHTGRGENYHVVTFSAELCRALWEAK